MRWFPLVLLALIPACKEKVVVAATAKPPTVEVANPEVREVQLYVETSGRTRATERVEVRARVTGFLESMDYTVGQRSVKKGDVLFRIEKDRYVAAVNLAKAELMAAEAEEVRAKSDLDRFEKAAKTNAVSQVEVTRARADKMKADAAIMAAKAALRDAELDLEYCDVISPIDGIPSRNLVDAGNLVDGSERTHLTTVVAISPIYVYFDLPEKYVNEARRQQNEKGASPEEKGTYEVRLATPGDDGFPHKGVVDFADNEINPETGTLQARAVVPNENRALFSGVFVRVRIDVALLPDAILIEERAIGTDLAGKFVLVVGEDNVVERRSIVLGQREGVMRVVNEGLEAKDRYIVVGQLRARAGLPVTIREGESK